MDNQAALEMPSPKRMRLESPGPGANQNIQLVDETNDVHVAPKARIDQTKPKTTPLSEPVHLPGLSTFDHTPAASNEASESERVDQNLAKLDSNSVSCEELIESEKPMTGPRSIPIGSDEISSEQANGPSATDFFNQISVSPKNDGHSENITVGEMASANVKPEESVSAAIGESRNDGIAPEATSGVSDNSGTEGIGDAELPPAEKHLPEDAQADGSVNVSHGEQVILQRSNTPNGDSRMATFEELANSKRIEADAEFQLDSSPYQSSSSSDSSSETSSSEDSKDSGIDDYEMLSPEEEARRLMAEDGGADEKVPSGGPRTLNEKPEDVVPKPNVIITTDMKLEELGRVENLVENLALIKANTSGEYQVLESGSVLCLEDSTVIGAVAETLGRVQQPYYSVRFTNQAAMSEVGVAQGTKIFYVDKFSTTVFTQPLKGLKGSDASNLHDEEVGDDELEFSDDEAEAEHKRQIKLQKRARYDAKHGQKDGFSRGPQQRPGKPNGRSHEPLNSLPERPPDLANNSLNYDDAANESEDLYTPLTRPSDLHMMMNPANGQTHNEANRGNTSTFSRGQGRGDRGEGRGRHRGNRGMSRGAKYNDRGVQRSSFEDGSSHAHPAQNSVPNQSSNSLPPRPPHQHQDGGIHSHPQSYHPASQPPAYSSSTPHSHPSYTPQYAPPFNQSYQQYQQPQYNSAPYQQGTPQQNYFQPQYYPPNPTYPPQHSPTTPASSAAIPPGAHINPNFFRQQVQHHPPNWQQQQQQPQGQAQFPQQPYQQQQQYQQNSPTNGNAGPPQLSPEAARRLQENLNMLRGLNGA